MGVHVDVLAVPKVTGNVYYPYVSLLSCKMQSPRGNPREVYTKQTEQNLTISLIEESPI